MANEQQPEPLGQDSFIEWLRCASTDALRAAAARYAWYADDADSARPPKIEDAKKIFFALKLDEVNQELERREKEGL